MRVLRSAAGLSAVTVLSALCVSAASAAGARLVGGSDVSLPFGLRPVPDRRISPFGS